jgi:drug/metabolite transporter (DMT)-like permease
VEGADRPGKGARLSLAGLPLWLVATLCAAVFNSWRTAVQQSVRATLSVNGAGLVRYFYGLPVAIALLAAWCLFRGEPLPGFDLPMLGWAIAAGFAQILGTNLLLLAFSYHNYVAGTAYSKTEAIQGAILSLVLLGERLSWISWMGIAVGVFGVLYLAGGGKRLRLADVSHPAALCGLGAGLGYTMTSIFVKLATREVHTGPVHSGDMILAALFVLVVVQAGQVLMQGTYVLLRERGEMTRVLQSWRSSSLVGLLASLGSAGWFTGFALAPVALVRTVGQVEVFFTLGFSRLYLREAVKRHEVIALFCVALGVALALAGSL